MQANGEGRSKEIVDGIFKTATMEPRPYQKRIVTKALQMFTGEYRNAANELESNVDSVMIESPTGSGKTAMAMVEIKAMEAIHPGLVTAWIAMRRNLLAQAASENAKHGIFANIIPVSMFEKQPEALLKAKADGKKIMFCVDECQHDSVDSMSHLYNILDPDFTLGLSATPWRQDRQKLCFSKIIRDAGIHQLVCDGYLSKYDQYSIPDWKVETVAETYLREPERWGKSLFYFKNLDLCFKLSAIFKEHGIIHDVVTGNTDVDSQIEAFRNGEIPVLINCMKLTEGFDCASMQSVFVRDSVKGPTMQMAGRVFRKYPGLAAKQVIQSKTTKHPMTKTVLPRCQYLFENGEWLSLTVNPKLNLITQNVFSVIANAEVEPLPDFIQHRKQKVKKLRF